MISHAVLNCCYRYIEQDAVGDTTAQSLSAGAEEALVAAAAEAAAEAAAAAAVASATITNKSPSGTVVRVCHGLWHP